MPLSRHIFRAPTRFYKTGIVFMAYLNGHQNHFTMIGGQESGPRDGTEVGANIHERHVGFCCAGTAGDQHAEQRGNLVVQPRHVGAPLQPGVGEGILTPTQVDMSRQ